MSTDTTEYDGAYTDRGYQEHQVVRETFASDNPMDDFDAYCSVIWASVDSIRMICDCTVDEDAPSE